MKKSIKLNVLIGLISILLVFALTGCGGSSEGEGDKGVAPKIDGLTYTETLDLSYAECFDVYKYEGGYAYIEVYDDANYLLVPEGKKTPEGLDEDVVVIQQPVDDIYLAATASMSLFAAMDALDNISMSSLNASEWTVDAAKKAMEAGKIVYAGKYNNPDYELILDNECSLAVESTMIYHSPEVKEMIEELGIPVFVDRSSYESNPLGRTEWIKLYGVLVGKEDAAVAYFDSQKATISKLENFENTGKTVAFFYMSTDGKVVARSSTDYVPTMIDMAGGKYVFKDLVDEEGRTSVSMTMESFYDAAVDADYIIYNGSIDSSVKSIDDLIAKDGIFKKFKAVKEGNCWYTGNSMYQRSDVIGQMILDFNAVISEDDPGELEYLTKME